MNQKYFLFPFATAGDLTKIPNPTQGSGVVSYQQGFGSLYSENPLTVGTALEIDRAMFNAILYDMTTVLQNYQQNGSPEWIDTTDNGGAAFSYRIGSMVRYSSSGNAPFTPYLAIADNVTAVPAEGANWSQVATYKIVNTEVARAEAAETTLQTNINTEVARAEAAESALGVRITNETNRAEGEESTLQTQITNEVSRAETSEANLLATLNPGRYLGIDGQTTPGNYTFTVPAGVGYLKWHLVGGGGGGSDCNNASSTPSATLQSGGGGGGGAYGESEFAVSAGQSYLYTVGAGGAPQGNGGATSFTSPSVNAVAGGGSGASFQSAGFSSGGSGGVCSGYIIKSHNGQDGSDGQAATFIFTGNGGSSGFGGGGGRAGNHGGIGGKEFGGGGGGAYSADVNSTLYNGGPGAGGVVYIELWSGP
jgi:hypothetical protein